jgi:acyl-CoA thioester hydrolase
LASPIHGRKFLAGWRDMDMNAHMANTAYLDKAVDARMLTFRELGFPREEFVRLRLGVVVMRDEIEYRREVKLMDEITITFLLAGLALDASRFKVLNEVFASDGALCARITSTGGFMNLDDRKLVAPPRGILEIYRALPQPKTSPSFLQASRQDTDCAEWDRAQRPTADHFRRRAAPWDRCAAWGADRNYALLTASDPA